MKCPDCGKPFNPNNNQQPRCRACGYLRSLERVKRQHEITRGKKAEPEQPIGYWGEHGYIMKYLNDPNSGRTRKDLVKSYLDCPDWKKKNSIPII